MELRAGVWVVVRFRHVGRLSRSFSRDDSMHLIGTHRRVGVPFFFSKGIACVATAWR